MSIRFKLSPELFDGDNWTIVDSKQDVLDAVKVWLDEFADSPGEEFTVGTVEMSDEEVAGLKEV